MAKKKTASKKKSARTSAVTQQAAAKTAKGTPKKAKKGSARKTSAKKATDKGTAKKSGAAKKPGAKKKPAAAKQSGTKKKLAAKKTAAKKSGAKKTETRTAAKKTASSPEQPQAALRHGGGPPAIKIPAAVKPRPGVRKTSKHVDLIEAMPLAERERYFLEAENDRLAEVVEQSYVADLANILLDLRKATVKQLFDRLAQGRKRLLTDLVTLYYYKEYLTNPFPALIPIPRSEPVVNVYAILGVPRESSDEEIKVAYRLLARAHSPDVIPQVMREIGEERLKEIDQAYQLVKTPERRAETDRAIPDLHGLCPQRDQSWLESVLRIVE